MAGAHIDLHRRQNQSRHIQGGIAFFAHADELLLGNAFVHVNIVAALVSHGGFPLIFATAFRQIVVAEKHAGVVRQGQQLLHGLVQGAGITAGEVAAGGAIIRHEQGVAHKHCIADYMAHAGRGMPRGVNGPRLNIADLVGVTIGKQVIELAAVSGELGAGVEDLAEGVLHGTDVFTDRQLAADLFLNPGCRGKMIRMDMGFQQPFHGERFLFDVGHDLAGTVMAGAPGFGIVVQHGIHNGAAPGLRVRDNVADGVGVVIEKGFDGWARHASSLLWLGSIQAQL